MDEVGVGGEIANERMAFLELEAALFGAAIAEQSSDVFEP